MAGRTIHLVIALPNGDNPDKFTVSVSDVPARTVEYIHIFDPYRRGAARTAYNRLLHWARKRRRDDGDWLG